MTAKWSLMGRFWAAELAKQALLLGRQNIGDWRCRLLRRMSPLVCRFSDAGMTKLSPGTGGRRPKSAKARNRGRWGTDGAVALWGFCRGLGPEKTGPERLR